MNYTQIVSFKFQENGQRVSSERVKYMNTGLFVQTRKSQNLCTFKSGFSRVPGQFLMYVASGTPWHGLDLDGSFRGGSREGPGPPPRPPKMRPQHQNSTKLRPQNGSFRLVTTWAPPPDQILDPPLLIGCESNRNRSNLREIRGR